MPERRFPPIWSAEVTRTVFIVRDANGQALSCVYFEDERGRRSKLKWRARGLAAVPADTSASANWQDVAWALSGALPAKDGR
jgi:hypothetical protein